MNFNDLSERAQDVIRIGCNTLQIKIEAFFDALKAEMNGSDKMLCGWKEIGAALYLSPTGAMHRAKCDKLLGALILKDVRSVCARKSDIDKYKELRLKLNK